MDIHILIEILEKSVEKNGVAPLTNQHLLNILKMVKKSQEKKFMGNEPYPFDPNFD
jgi:hypothetical protein